MPLMLFHVAALLIFAFAIRYFSPSSAFSPVDTLLLPPIASYLADDSAISALIGWLIALAYYFHCHFQILFIIAMTLMTFFAFAELMLILLIGHCCHEPSGDYAT
jgi:hypothetical protein